MPVSQSQANSDLNAVYGSGSPATIYAALVTALPNFTANSGRGSITEPTSGSGQQWAGYAEVAITNNVTNWPAAAAGVKNNGIAITFPISGSTSTGCTLTHLVFLTTSGLSGVGYILDALSLPGSTIVSANQTLTFIINAVSITES